MTIGFALEYIPRRMLEMGHKEYYIKFRHLLLVPNQKIEIEAYNELYLLVEEASDISIHSEFGIYNLFEKNANELIYEHQGLITVNNFSTQTNHIKFIQVIPKIITTHGNITGEIRPI